MEEMKKIEIKNGVFAVPWPNIFHVKIPDQKGKQSRVCEARKYMVVFERIGTLWSGICGYMERTMEECTYTHSAKRHRERETNKAKGTKEVYRQRNTRTEI